MRKLLKKQIFIKVTDYVKDQVFDEQNLFIVENMNKLVLRLHPGMYLRADHLNRGTCNISMYDTRVPFYQSSKLCMKFTGV